MKIVQNSFLLLFLSILYLMVSAMGSYAQFRSMGQGGGSFGSSGGSGSNTTQRSYYTEGSIGEAIIEADSDTRSIIVITDEETNERIAEIIKNLDRPVPQVLIKVVFLEVTYHDDLDFGEEGAINASNEGRKGGIFETAYGLAAESQGGFYTLLDSDLQLTVRAIAEKGKTEILSRPSVLTRNNQEAVITVGQRVPFVTDVRISDTGLQTNTVEYEDIGIILRVTPFITQEGLVEMILAPEISTLTDQTIQVSDTVNSPVIANRSADTVVVTPNGKTVVIGGMMEDSNTETVKKVPLLGDIPLLGMAFRRTEKSKTKTELIIFLTPYVVETPKNLLDLSKAEKGQSELIPKAFPEEELDKFIGEHSNLESTYTDVQNAEVLDSGDPNSNRNENRTNSGNEVKPGSEVKSSDNSVSSATINDPTKEKSTKRVKNSKGRSVRVN